MASENRTVADIVREMRNDKTAGHFSIRVFLADCIEAAHKREVAELRRCLQEAVDEHCGKCSPGRRVLCHKKRTQPVPRSRRMAQGAGRSEAVKKELTEWTNEELADHLTEVIGGGIFKEFYAEAARRLRSITVRTDNSAVIAELQRRLKVAEDALESAWMYASKLPHQWPLPERVRAKMKNAIAAIREGGDNA